MLNGITIIDITNNMAGPSCAAMLADHGAEVIHIEKPIYGDDNRKFVPAINGTSFMHFCVNRNKKSVVLDLKTPEGVAVIKKLAETADILIESNRPGVMSRLGLGYDVIHEINPSLVYCSVSAFGQSGPYANKAGYDIIAQAYCSMLYYTGEPDAKPVKNSHPIGDFVTAYNAYGSIMTALYHRAVTGEGQHVDVSLARTMLYMNNCIPDHLSNLPRRRTGRHDIRLCPYGIFDGPNGDSIIIAALSVSLWEKLCDVMGMPELANDPRFQTNDARCQRINEVIEIIEGWLNSFDKIEEAAALLDAQGIPNIKAYTSEDILKDEHARSQGWIKDLPLPEFMGPYTCPTMTGVADFSAADIQYKPAPYLGEHSIEILMRCGMTEEEAIAYEASLGH